MADTYLHAGVAVTLTIPATNDHISYARLLTTAVAGKLGFDFDTIEDVRIAVSELCGTIIAVAKPGSELRIDIRGGDTGLSVNGQVSLTEGSRLETDELSDQVLAVVTDSYGYDVRDGVVSFQMTRAATAGIV